MKINISPQMTIFDLKQVFNECFPHLSLSFFTKPHAIYEPSPVKFLITECSTVLERLERNPHRADVEISGDMTVFELEQLFEDEFGLHVQVLRQEGNTWAETTFTDNHTLREQNMSAAQTKAHVCDVAYVSNFHDSRTEWYLG